MNTEDTTKVLKQYSDKEIEAEVERRAVERAQDELKKRRVMVEKVIANRDALLEFVTHSRTSCREGSGRTNDGYHPDHGGADCPRCCLLALQEHHDDIEISVSLQMCQTPPRGRGR